MTDSSPWLTSQRTGSNLADVLERVLDKGLVIAGDIKICLLDIELLTIKLRLLVAGTSGRAYLRQLSRRQRRRDESRQHATAAAERIDTALGACALDRSHHRPQAAQLSGASGHNILNAAYLTAAGRAGEFTALARRLTRAEPALRVEVTGPWAPYSFTGTGTGPGHGDRP